MHHLLQVGVQIARGLHVVLPQSTDNSANFPLRERFRHGLALDKHDLIHPHEGEQHADGLPQAFARNDEELLVVLLLLLRKRRKMLRVVQNLALLIVRVVGHHAESRHQRLQNLKHSLVLLRTAARLKGGQHRPPVQLQALHLIEELSESKLRNRNVGIEMHQRHAGDEIGPHGLPVRSELRLGRLR